MPQAPSPFRAAALACLAAASHAAAQPNATPTPDATTTGPPPGVIAFGSCLHHSDPKPALDAALAHQPDAFVFLGDNHYADATDPDDLRAAYQTLGQSPELRRVFANTRVFATWDDHDYWNNDSGKRHPHRAESEAQFEDFWGLPLDHPARQRPGIYASYQFTDGQHSLQLILLDTRFFRDDLTRNGDGRGYAPNDDPSLTLLGDDQWAWLESQLAVPADVRILASSIQLAHQHNGYESWTNFPHEQARLLDLLHRAPGRTVVITGDLHQSDVSVRRADPDAGQRADVWDVTSSNLNRGPWREDIPNRFRATPDDTVETGNHFGLIRIHWPDDPNNPDAEPAVTVELRRIDDSLIATLDLNAGRVTPPR